MHMRAGGYSLCDCSHDKHLSNGTSPFRGEEKGPDSQCDDHLQPKSRQPSKQRSKAWGLSLYSDSVPCNERGTNGSKVNHQSNKSPLRELKGFLQVARAARRSSAHMTTATGTLVNCGSSATKSWWSRKLVQSKWCLTPFLFYRLHHTGLCFSQATQISSRYILHFALESRGICRAFRPPLFPISSIW